MGDVAYEDYKPSGINTIDSIPKHWTVRRLKFMARIQNGKDYKEVAADDGFPVIGSGGEFAKANNYLYNGESVLLGRKGTIDRPLYINGPFWTVDTMFYTEVANDVSAKYLYYCALTINFLKYATSTALPSMTQQDLGAIPFALPRHDEQQAIASFLDFKTAQIDALIAKKKTLLDKLTEKRTALISHAITKGLDQSAPMKNSGVAWLGEVPAHWKISRIKFVARVGNGSTPSRDRSDYWADGHFPWLNSSVVNQEEVTESDQFVTDVALKECHLPIIQPPAALIGITGQGKTRGMASKLSFEATINQHLAYVKPLADEIGVDYLVYLFERAYTFLRNESDGGGSTKGAITCEQIANLQIPLPPLSEQVAIEEHVSGAIERITEMRRKVSVVIERLREYRSALITNAVTGKIDVRTFDETTAATLN